MSHHSRYPLQTTSAASWTISSPSLLNASSYARVIGANDRVRIALAGAGIRGGEHVGFYKQIPNVDIVWLVDPDSTRTLKMAARIEKEFRKEKPKTGSVYRAMLDDPCVDLVSVASPNSWHALMGIWACQAGKDVYLEKPCSHHLHEGRILVETAKKTGRLVQHGTQYRSEKATAKMVAAVQSEKYGKLVTAKVYSHRPRDPLGFKPITEPPKTLDWEQWIGPVAMIHYHENLVPYNWHWFWNTGNGEIGNNGVHHFDVCSWGMKTDHPTSVLSFGARFVNDPKNRFRDQGETPTLQWVLYDFDGIPLIYESCNIAGSEGTWQTWEKPEFHTEQGILRDGRFFPNDGSPSVAVEPGLTWSVQGINSGRFVVDHFTNLIDCMRNRGTAALNAPIERGHYSSAICHWGNASYRTGEPASLEKIRGIVEENALLRKSFERIIEHVTGTISGLDAKDIPFRLGRRLMIDGAKEKFIDAPDADLFLTRSPREPFGIPDSEESS